MAVIELGVITGDDHRMPPWRPHPGLLAAVLVVLCLLTVAGSAPPRSGTRAFAGLWSMAFRSDSDAYSLTADALYVFSGDQLSAYDPRTGAARWTTPGLDGVVWTGRIESGVALLESENADFGSRGYQPDTVAVDTATGRELWRRPGETVDVRPGRVLLAGYDNSGRSVLDFRVVNLRDGATLWSKTSLEVRTDLAVSADRLVTGTAAGHVTVRDGTDGRLLVTTDRLWPVKASTTVDFGVADRVLFVLETDFTATTLTVYDSETLRELWHVRRVINGFYPCGPVMCLNDDLGLSGVDQRTGRRLWFRAGGGYAQQLSDDRLLVDDSGSDLEDSPGSLVAAGTGEQLADLGTMALIQQDSRPGPAYLMKRRTRQQADRSAIAELDERTGTVTMRGTIERPLDYGCETALRMLACTTEDGRLTVTDLGVVQ